MNGSKIARASLAVFIAHIIFKLLGSVQFFAVYWSIDAGVFDAVYGFAFEGVIFSLFLIGEEMIGPALLPLFMQEREAKPGYGEWKILNSLWTLHLCILLLVVIVLFSFPEWALSLTYWSEHENPEQFIRAKNALRWMSPALIGLSMASTTYIVLNAYKRFFLAAFADSMVKIGILISLAIGVGLLRGDYRALIIGVVVAGTAKLLTHLWGLRAELKYLRPSFDFKNPAFKQLLLLMLPLAVGILVAKFRDVYNSVTVLSSLNTDGLIKANMFGRKLYQTIGMLVPYTISIAIFPFLCKLAAKKDLKRLGSLLSNACRMLLLIFVPLSLILVFLSPALSSLIVGGTISQREAQWAVTSLACYTLVLPSYALEPILMQGFFAQKKTMAVVVLGILCSFISIGISFIAIRIASLENEQALMAIALGYTLSRVIKTFLLSSILRRSLPLAPLRSTVFFVLKIIPLSLVAAFVGRLTFEYLALSMDQGRLVLLFNLALSSFSAVGVLLLSAWLIKLKELHDVVYWTKKRLMKRG